jgi:hypothetical protein
MVPEMNEAIETVAGLMFGHFKAETNVGCSYPDAKAGMRPFRRDEVAAFGKSNWYGSYVTWFWVRLADGTVLNVKTASQAKEDGKWLTKLSKKLGYIGDTSRHSPEAFGWLEIKDADGPVCAHGILQVLTCTKCPKKEIGSPS